MDKRIIKLAFCGKMGAGKTTASMAALGLLTDIFGEEESIGYIIKFAQPLYTSLLAFHRNTKGTSERMFLQRLGDLARREFGDDVMERIFRDNVEGLITNKLPTLGQKNVLIMTDDLRFMGEYKLLRDLNFCIIKVEASEDMRRYRLGEAFTNVKHRSEVEQDSFEPDFTINNDVDEVGMLALTSQLQSLVENKNLFGV